eukprot:6475341-Amphidinium_carterae.1
MHKVFRENLCASVLLELHFLVWEVDASDCKPRQHWSDSAAQQIRHLLPVATPEKEKDVRFTVSVYSNLLVPAHSCHVVNSCQECSLLMQTTHKMVSKTVSVLGGVWAL